MKDTNEKYAKTIEKLAGPAILLLCGFAGGYYAMAFLDTYITENMPQGELFFFLAFSIFSLAAGFFLHLIIHEAGHLFFGLKTGYEFLSFRIGSLMWIRENGKIRVKYQKLEGTGGQCLMSPPEEVNGTFPYKLYNLGGCIFNLIIATVFTLVFFIFKQEAYIAVFSLMMAFSGFIIALANGIPLSLGAIDNDGRNTVSIGKSPEALHAFGLQLTINRKMAEGCRVKDLPEEWFILPDESTWNNSMCATIAVFCANRMVDMHQFEDAKELIDRLLNKADGMIGLHRNLLIADRIYLEALENQTEQIYEQWRRKSYHEFVKQMKAFPSIIRSEYAYYLLVSDNGKYAKELRQNFEKIAKSFPYSGDIESERELIQIAHNKKKELNQGNYISM